MDEIFDFIVAMLGIDHTSSRRKRVFSRGFVIFLFLVAVFEIAILSAWAQHR
jgi:hypothetical protein